MKIVNREDFLKLPAGTVYAKFGDTLGTPGHFYFGEPRIKDCPRGTSDWYSVGFFDGFPDATDSGKWADTLERLAADATLDVPIDHETIDSDGLYDDGQLFAVYSLQDLDSMIARLQQARAALESEPTA